MHAPRFIYLVLALTVISGSQAGNIIRLGHAHPLTMAAWRLVLASLLLLPSALPQLAIHWQSVRRQLGWIALASIAIAAHLISWIAGVQHTTVANAAMAFSINPIITAAAGYWFFGERVNRKLALSIALGMLGIGALGSTDLRLQPEHLVGDGLAILSSSLFTVYLLCGKKVRETLPIAAYVVVLYGVAGMIGFTAMAALGLPFWGYDRNTWICFGLLAVVPTIIGHSLLNYAVKYIPANRVSTAMLSEPALAGIVAYFAWGEAISTGAMAGYAFICVSILILSWDRWSSRK
jgi:drug/metabolite transporter (DMT)-like permease